MYEIFRTIRYETLIEYAYFIILDKLNYHVFIIIKLNIKIMNGLISPDKLISVWILVYFILYKLKLVKYNPIILFYIGLLFVIFGCFYVLIYGKMSKRFLMFIILNILIKVIPIIILYKDKIQSRDVSFTFIFLIVYILYLTIRNEDVINLYKDIVMNVIDINKGRQGYATKFMNEGI